jgi:NADP-dependent 3-hydroxy acid dehydrogenase YdfG
MNILITGTSSGLGYELAKQFISKGDTVYGISRGISDLNIKQIQCDFHDLQAISIALNKLIDVTTFDLVILNAGMLGDISKTNNLRIDQFQNIFTVNVLANKVIIDWLLNHNVDIKNVIGISTGAALKTYYGWSLYCTSKAAFKQLISSYAQETPDIHFISLAPGIIKTKMQDYIYSLDEKEIPSINKFKTMYKNMDTADIVAKKIIKWLPKIKEFKSGNYHDLRN